MYNVKVSLAVAAMDVANPENSGFILRGDKLPERELLSGRRSSFELAQDIFFEITGTSPTPWVTVRQIGAFDKKDSDTVTILYSILIPEKVPIIDEVSRWADFDTISKIPEVHSLFGYVCNFYKV